jgi:hypothetical protein
MIRWDIDVMGDTHSRDSRRNSRFTIRRRYRGDGGGVKEYSLWDNKTGEQIDFGLPKKKLKLKAEEILRKEEGR